MQPWGQAHKLKALSSHVKTIHSFFFLVPTNSWAPAPKPQSPAAVWISWFSGMSHISVSPPLPGFFWTNFPLHLILSLAPPSPSVSLPSIYQVASKYFLTFPLKLGLLLSSLVTFPPSGQSERLKWLKKRHWKAIANIFSSIFALVSLSFSLHLRGQDFYC